MIYRYIDDIWIGSIESTVESKESPPFTLRFYIDTNKIITVVDSGSQYNLMDQSTWNSLQIYEPLQITDYEH